MNVNKSSNIRFKTALIIIVLSFVMIIGITYAFFSARLNTNSQQSSVTVSAGKLELTYYDGNGTIILDNLFPGELIEKKTFSVKNTGRNYIEDYEIYLDKVENDLVYNEDLTYILTCKEYNQMGDFVKDCSGSQGTFPKINTKLCTNPIFVGYTHEYELTVTYEETYTDQSNDMDKVVKARIAVIDNSEVSVESSS